MNAFGKLSQPPFKRGLRFEVTGQAYNTFCA